MVSARASSSRQRIASSSEEEEEPRGTIVFTEKKPTTYAQKKQVITILDSESEEEEQIEDEAYRRKAEVARARAQEFKGKGKDIGQSSKMMAPRAASSTSLLGSYRNKEDTHLTSASKSASRSPISEANQRIRAVEIPYIPRNILRRYDHHSGTFQLPSRSTSIRSESESSDMPYETRSRSISPRKTRTRARQASDGDGADGTEASSSDPIGAEWESEEEEDEDEDEDMDDEDEDDSVRHRRSSRNFKERVQASKEAISKRLRGHVNGRASGVSSRSSVNPAISESSFYGMSAKPAPKRKLNNGWSTGADISNDSSAYEESEGEEEVDELESESYSDSDWDDGPKKKGRRKGKKAKRAISEEQETEEDILNRHRAFCERCKQGPADVLLEKALKKKRKGSSGKKRKKDEDAISEDEVAEQLQGWLECTHCVTAWHWGCLGSHQQRDALQLLALIEGPPPEGERKRRDVGIDEAVTFQCRRCQDNPTCMECHKEELPKQNGHAIGKEDVNGGEEQEDMAQAALQFRCIRCTQSAHYQHLRNPFPPEQQASLADIAEHYQFNTESGKDAWLCHQCREWTWKVDIVIAWRPLPADAEEDLDPGEVPAWNSDLQREYLVKFVDRGFRHATWVPHPWIRALAPQRLRNFLEKGPSLDLVTDETLAAKGDEMDIPTIAKVMEEAEAVQQRSRHAHVAGVNGDEGGWKGGGPPPDRDAKEGLPIAWSTIDRVLDIYLLPPPVRKKAKNKKTSRIESDSEVDKLQYDGPDGLLPRAEDRVSVDEWEVQAGRQLGEDDVDEIAGMVSWCFVKWDDLQYDQSTWDTPPPRDTPLYTAYKRALKRYLGARNVVIPVLTASQCAQRDSVKNREVIPPSSQPDCVVGGKLMNFQLEGLQWLVTKYYKRGSAILADDMGLGKTVQIASLLGYLGQKKMFPCLVVVPNSTITNWVREFEKWVPHMRVVPYYGESASDGLSRKVIREYELYHKGKQGKAEGLKAHIVLTTYDMVVGKEVGVFSRIPRWEILCVDEGQRLKSDGSLIWGNLKKLNSVHRLLLTGTPLNNNIRELFNLLNFLDPAKFTDREELEERFDQDSLTEELVRELHTMVQPYILRRIKADVLRLPPKIEIIVPITFADMQRTLYLKLLEVNANKIKEAAIAAQKRKDQAANRKAAQVKKAAIKAAEANGDASVEPIEVADGAEGAEKGASLAEEVEVPLEVEGPKASEGTREADQNQVEAAMKGALVRK